MKPIPSALAAPWAIEPHWLRVVFGVWSRGQLDAAAIASARADWEARLKAGRPRLDVPGAPVEGTGGTLRIVGDVGVITVEGPLFRHADMFTEISGGCSYDAIWRGLEAAERSFAVRTILFRFNSPGGEADGVSELAKGIAGAREHKPVYAYVDGMCASAAYWLASQTERIIAEETSEVGCIGVRCGIVDHSAADQMVGVREIEIISSQTPAKRSKPVDDAVIGRMQTRIDDLAELFIAAVARGRGTEPETVVADFGQGDVMIASKALAVGLIDEIGNFNGTLAALAAASPSGGGPAARAKDRTMTMINKPVAAGEGGEWQCAGCNEMMGPSAQAYCAKCAEDDNDDEPDGDEGEAKALGLDPKVSAAARRERVMALAELERDVMSALGATKSTEIRSKLAAAVESHAAIGELRKRAAAAVAEGVRRELRATLERGLAGAPGKPATLSLGAIQKTLPVALRGEAKKAWLAAMDKLSADADATGKGVTATQVVEAACSVQLSSEDLEAVREYVQASAPVAAPNFIEPHRDGVAEGAELDQASAEVARLANKARAVLDRNHKPAAK